MTANATSEQAVRVPSSKRREVSRRLAVSTDDLGIAEVTAIGIADPLEGVSANVLCIPLKRRRGALGTASRLAFDRLNGNWAVLTVDER